MSKVSIKKGDTVVVLSGDDKGAKGPVKLALPKRNRVIVAGVNMIKKHQKPTGSTRTQVGIIEREAPIHISNLALYCPKCERGVRVGYEVAADGSKTRVCRHCGEPV
jgi:large subunit ribosomal protein L24